MTKLAEITRTAIDPALALLPKNMDSKLARVMLLAIGLQESRFEHRRQLVGNPPRPVGPAKSFWQAEKGGGMIHGVRTHKLTASFAADLCKARGVLVSNQTMWDAVEHDDVLAAGLARLLLWSDAQPLPVIGNADGAWMYYLYNWRPGKPHYATWAGFYEQAVKAVC